jgi:hypothetical protein
LFAVLTVDAPAQTVIFSSLTEVLNGVGDTIVLPHEVIVHRRTRNQQLLAGGADYRLMSEARSVSRRIQSAYAIQIDTALYVNCRRLRYNRMRFGGYYAPAIRVGSSIFFSAIPLGNVADRFTSPTHTLGELGNAITSSAVFNVRVYYEIHRESGDNISFVNHTRMRTLLQPHGDLFDSYTASDREEADSLTSYLLELAVRQ